MLDEGLVNLVDAVTFYSQLLNPSEKGYFYVKSRKLRIEAGNGHLSSSWMRGEMLFFGIELRDVIESIEKHYDVKIYFPDTDMLNQDKFTATFSARNLIEALEMIKYCYGMNYMVSAKEVVYY